MPDGQLIEFDHATKRFGTVAAVSDLSARVRPGVVTGFLGPNGAGKTTTLRMLLGLERPTSGNATIGGTRYAELRNPARVIGAMLEDPGFRQRRTVERHLIQAAKANGIQLSRVGELISFVGLGDDVDTRIAALSLGMRQRLSAATALIGDPGVLVLDEPANGLDPEGIRWMRTLIRGLADEGRTVLVSSHVLSEVEQIADEILVIARGELKFAGTMEDLADPRSGPVVLDAADRGALSTTLHDAGYEFEVLRSGLTVRGSDAATIGGVIARAGVALTTLQQRGPTLEDVFLDLVHDRYVPPAPVPEETALFDLPDAAADAEPDVERAETPEPDTEPDEAPDTEPDVERAEGETKRAERAER
ncbi:ABC transporter ATP-binding protein, partial [Microbacterium sp.]|uniref:ABC transporter ATP-binding protein n=1 Tax=Microbacterium sp. TaxID=51671 RepID=UPI003F9BEE9B